jgi:2-amino-4-hydroxy-6-hydroxymethyldihydropteridine diphosphokinase
MSNIAIIGIGSNLGDRIANCQSAMSRLGNCHHTRVLDRSSLYETAPVGYVDQDPFINCVIKIETMLDPLGLLQCLSSLERTLGRKKTFVWGPRVIDLDILLFNTEEWKSKDLQIPHPRLHERAFVLVPLCEIDPQVVHPSLRKTSRELLEDLGETVGVEKI